MVKKKGRGGFQTILLSINRVHAHHNWVYELHGQPPYLHQDLTQWPEVSKMVSWAGWLVRHWLSWVHIREKSLCSFVCPLVEHDKWIPYCLYHLSAIFNTQENRIKMDGFVETPTVTINTHQFSATVIIIHVMVINYLIEKVFTFISGYWKWWTGQLKDTCPVER